MSNASTTSTHDAPNEQAADRQGGAAAHIHDDACGCGHEHHHHGGPGTLVRAAPRIGRNDPCPCGSGKKYKKCCLT